MNPKCRFLMKSLFLFLSVALVGWFVAGCEKNPAGPGEEGEDTLAVFDENLFNLRLTEIHYNPADLDDRFPSDSLEFIEIKNTGIASLDLGGLAFDQGITYVFPDSTILEPDGFFVIASSENGFKERYGLSPDGVYTGQLKNGGERITLVDTATDSVIFSQPYEDTEGWPQEADGGGYSLVTIKGVPARDLSGPSIWRKSARLNGSPGEDDVVKEIDSTLFNLRITELHYNPLDLDGTDGDSIEFIELKNVGSTELPLGTVAFTEGVRYAFPDDAKLDAGAFIVLASDSETFKRRYPDVDLYGEYADNLSNTGEKVVVFDIASDVQLIVIDFNDNNPWPKVADGDGYSIVPVSANPDRTQDDPAAWRCSRRVGGSPGADDPGIVLVNEVLTHTDPPDYDAIELYNPGDEPVDVGGWYLTDRKVDPIKFRIPDSTFIAAGGYVFFDETDFNADSTFASFNLNSHGEEVWLVADERGCTQGYCHGFTFGEIENGISFGRHVTSTGREVFVAQKDVTLGEANSGPLVGPLVISEIMYHSADNAGDFIEITNVSGQEVKLYHPDYPDTTWKVSGIGFRFPPNSVIKTDESVVIATDSISDKAFRTRYDVPDDVQIFTMTGGLKNGSENLKLLKPEDPYVEDSTKSTTPVYPYMLIDEVEYSDGSNWPSADGNGMSLHRKPGTYGDDRANWSAGSPSPGRPGAEGN
ncbi:MAG: lamin tail domain-containing protein [Chitinispirillaceae bacterium]|nr:lamin tail domain-containing protein [Chitinispirillaceae bacterium]